MSVTFKFVGPHGYTPTVFVCRADTQVVLDSGVAAESSTALGHYSVELEVGSYTGAILAYTLSPKGSYYGQTSTGQLQDFPSELGDILAAIQATDGVEDPVRDGRVVWKGFIGESTKDVNTPDYTGTTIKVVIEHETSGEAYTILDGAITKTSSTISFAVPAAFKDNSGKYLYSIRRSDDYVLHYGDYIIQRTAYEV